MAVHQHANTRPLEVRHELPDSRQPVMITQDRELSERRIDHRQSLRQNPDVPSIPRHEITAQQQYIRPSLHQ